MTRRDRLYRVWLERELGRITTDEAWERVDEIQAGVGARVLLDVSLLKRLGRR